MLEVLDSPKHLVAIRLSGDLSAGDVAKTYKAVEDAVKDNERISFFAEIDPSMSLTFSAIVEDIVSIPGQLRRLCTYYRVALVTDKSWLAAIARIEGVVFSGIDFRVFGPAERDKAFAWASQEPEPLKRPADPEPALRILHTSNENVFAYEIDGRLTQHDIKTAVEALRPYFKREGKFSVLARMKNYKGFDLFAVLNDEYIEMKLKSPSRIAKYAIIGPTSWMRNLVELTGGWLPTKIRTFDPADEADAWEWIGAQHSLLTE